MIFLAVGLIEMTTRYMSYLLTDLCLEKVNILGKIESVLPAVSYHVGVEDVIGLLEHSGQMALVRNLLQRAL